jgi:hypothetical protein
MLQLGEYLFLRSVRELKGQAGRGCNIESRKVRIQSAVLIRNALNLEAHALKPTLE